MLDDAMCSLDILLVRQGASKRLPQTRGQEIQGEGSRAQIRYPVVPSTPGGSRGNQSAHERLLIATSKHILESC